MTKKNATNEGSPADTAARQMEAAGTTAPPDLSIPKLQAAVHAGQKVLADGGTKADAARTMFEMTTDEPKETVVAAFVAGATLTEKGALTYWYNCKRKAAKAR